MNNPNPILVTYFQRKPIMGFHFSVEIIFNDVRKYLSDKYKSKIWIAPYFSKGLVSRLISMVHALFVQGDINHVTGDISFVGLLLKKKKTVQTILDCVFLKNRSGIPRLILKWFWLDLPVMRASKVTTISRQVKEEIIAMTGCDESKIKVIPIALSDVFKERPAKDIHGLPKILMIGNAPNKNWERVLDALKEISCEIHIIAKEDNEFKEKLIATGATFHYFSGFSQLQMLEKYNEMDLMLFASTYEGFGMPIIEAQAVGVPVVTSNISSMPEVAGGAAHLVDPYNVQDIKSGVEKVLADKNYRNELIRLGKENVRRFSPEYIAAQYEVVYDEIIHKRNNHNK